MYACSIGKVKFPCGDELANFSALSRNLSIDRNYLYFISYFMSYSSFFNYGVDLAYLTWSSLFRATFLGTWSALSWFPWLQIIINIPCGPHGPRVFSRILTTTFLGKLPSNLLIWWVSTSTYVVTWLFSIPPISYIQHRGLTSCVYTVNLSSASL